MKLATGVLEGLKNLCQMLGNVARGNQEWEQKKEKKCKKKASSSPYRTIKSKR